MCFLCGGEFISSVFYLHTCLLFKSFFQEGFEVTESCSELTLTAFSN